MSYGLIVDTPAGIRKIDETGLGYYRVEFEGVCTSTPLIIPGNAIGPDRVIAVSYAINATQWGYSGQWESVVLQNGNTQVSGVYVGMPYLVLSRVGWSSNGWGLLVANASGQTIFNTNDKFFAITSVLNVNITTSDPAIPYSLGVHAGKQPYFLITGLGPKIIRSAPGNPIYQYTQLGVGFKANQTLAFDHDWNNHGWNTTYPYPATDFVTIPIGVVL